VNRICGLALLVLDVWGFFLINYLNKSDTSVVSIEARVLSSPVGIIQRPEQ